MKEIKVIISDEVLDNLATYFAAEDSALDLGSSMLLAIMQAQAYPKDYFMNITISPVDSVDYYLHVIVGPKEESTSSSTKKSLLNKFADLFFS